MLKVYKYIYFAVPRLKFLKQAKGRKYLDFGCGDGVALRQNLEIRPDLKFFCLDIQDFSKELPKDISFIVYDGINIPYKEGSFEIITVNHILEHVPNPIMLLSELERIMQVGGRIFIEVPNERSLWGKPGGRFGGTVHFQDDPTHITPYSKRDLNELCKKTRFKVIKIGISRNLLHLILSPVLFAIGLLMPKKLWFMYARNSVIGWASYIILEKRK